MSVMIDYKTKTNARKVLFNNIDQLAWLYSLGLRQQEAATANTIKLADFSGSGIPRSTVMHCLVLTSIHTYDNACLCNFVYLSNMASPIGHYY